MFRDGPGLLKGSVIAKIQETSCFTVFAIIRIEAKPQVRGGKSQVDRFSSTLSLSFLTERIEGSSE